MSWFTQFLSSSVGKKVLMALTGLFLCSFLVIHMAGNFQLLHHDNGLAFNEYAAFMTGSPLIKTVSYLLYLSILLHAVQGIIIALSNQKARPQKYAYTKAGASSSWASRNMAILGSIIFIFLVIHMKSFWYEMHFGGIGTDANGHKNLYEVVKAAFHQWWYVAFYIVALIALAFHLIHGFQSAFRSLGLMHNKYTPIINGLGIIFSIGVCLGFAIQPLYILLMT
ncbi:MAG: succinate dehydrogenase cytochrome b subunit [Chitinophagales bacterium]|nr:succinate dehydrogenase cytochrome b subunit [Bacteroidota bacterium]